MSPIEMVRAREEQIKFNRFESAFAVEGTGRVLLDKTGDQSWIGFTEEEMERLSAGEGVIFTHNHPRGWDYPSDDPRHGGSSFSDADVEFACTVELAELRVVTPDRRFFMRPPGQGWHQDYWLDVLRPEYLRQEEAVKKDFRQAVRLQRMTRPEAGARLYHEIWTRIAREINLVYGEEQE